MLPITDVNALAVGSQGDADRPKIRWRVGNQIFLRKEFVACSFSLDLHAHDLPFAEVAEEKIAAIIARQRIFVVCKCARRSARAEIGHHPQRVWPLRNEIVWIS